LSFCLEGFRQRGELAADVLEEQPLFDDFGHSRFIARRRTAWLAQIPPRDWHQGILQATRG
jgi:hypothetical protein